MTQSLVYNNSTAVVIESEMNTIKVFSVNVSYSINQIWSNKCGLQLFAQYGWQLKKLPHTQDSLNQHVLRAVY